MLDDERPLDSLANDCHADDAVRFPEDYGQWFPILSFDGSRVMITRPTDAMETTVMQPAHTPSTAVHPSMTQCTSTVPGKVDDGSAAETSATSTNGHHDAGSPAGVGPRSIGDTVWLQMRKRSEIQTTDGRMIELVTTTSHTDVSNQNANSLAGIVESTGDRAAKGTAEARSKRVAERHRAMVERRKRRLRVTIVVSTVVTAISLVALIASIA